MMKLFRKTKVYSVRMVGSEANTVLEMELTASERKLLTRVSKESKRTSRYGGMPTLEVHPL